jgi:hypothetical protein
MATGLEGLQVNTWFKGVIAVSAISLAAAITTNRANVAVTATGVLIFGFGQWINHPKRVGFTGRFKVTSTAREACVSGLFLEAIGIVLALFGAWRLHQFGL